MTLYYGRDLDPDELREQMIDTLRLRYLGAKTSAEKHELFNEMRVLIAGRSSAQVERMERERGLR